MKKILKWFCGIFLFFLCIFIIGVQIINQILVEKVPMWIEKASMPVMQFSVEKAEKIAWWKIGVSLKQVDVILPNQKMINLKNVDVSIPLWLPIRVNVKAMQQRGVAFDASFSKSQWFIHHLKGEIDSFQFDVKGNIHRFKDKGYLDVQTKGLGQFLNQFVEIPLFLKMFIGNQEQNFVLKPENGWLSFKGVPIIPLSP